MRNDQPPYTYTDAGFDGFFRRSIESDPNTTTLRGMAASFQQVNNNAINFDAQQVTGSLGDKLQVGSAIIDGAKGRFSIVDSGGQEVARFGDLGE